MKEFYFSLMQFVKNIKLFEKRINLDQSFLSLSDFNMNQNYKNIFNGQHLMISNYFGCSFYLIQ